MPASKQYAKDFRFLLAGCQEQEWPQLEDFIQRAKNFS